MAAGNMNNSAQDREGPGAASGAARPSCSSAGVAGEAATNLSFSIIMPTFKRRDEVVAAVSALARLRYAGSLEVIVVVDGSADGTEEALRELSTPFPLRVIVQLNRGPARARNTGAAAARGEILLFLDDDMIAKPDMLDQHARSYREGADAVLGHVPLDRNSPRNFLSRRIAEWAEAKCADLALRRPNYLDVMSGQLSVRRDIFGLIAGFDCRFSAYGNEDTDLGCRLFSLNTTVVFNPNAISYHRYVVDFRTNLRQRRQQGHADVIFARKHPDRASELFAANGSVSKAAGLLRPLAKVPLLADVSAKLAIFLAEREPMGHWLTERIFWYARVLAYWRGVHEAGGVPPYHGTLVHCVDSVLDSHNSVEDTASPRTSWMRIWFS